MLSRSVLILRYKQPFVDWINATDPNPVHKFKLADANADSTAYLIEVKEDQELAAWIELNGVLILEQELRGWYPDPDTWPQHRSVALLKSWCTYELHTLVFDTGTSPILDEEADDDAEE